jgi:hypothetical protein
MHPKGAKEEKEMTTTPTTGSMGKGFIQCVLIGILFVFVGVYSKYSNHTSPPPPAHSQVSPVAPTAPTVKVGKEKQLYRFSKDTGCVSVTLRSDAEFYPKGGEIIITPPKPGKPWNDEPGTVHTLPRQEAGEFTVCAEEDSDAWGVDIWQ